jgi:hypothetical protein
MANESTTGGPLTATVGEQLAGKGHLGAAGEVTEPAGPHEGEGASPPRSARPTSPAGSAAVRLPWGAILAAGAGWLLAKTIARALRKPARSLARGFRRR